MKKCLLVCLFFIQVDIGFSQELPAWRIGVNPFSLAESRMSMGPAIGYRLNSRIEIWAEAGVIFANSYMPDRWKNMSGFRFILQPRYFFSESRSLFFSPEFRLKNFSFENRLSFINASIPDTLTNFGFRESQTILGGALVLGKQYILSKKAELVLECTVGLGARHRLIKRNEVPDGYSYFSYGKGGSGLAPAYEENNSGTVLCPLGFRLMWTLK